MLRLNRFITLLLIALLLAGCGGASTPAPTAPPTVSLTAQQVIDALRAAGLSVQNPTQDMSAGRGAPGGFVDRQTFEIHIRDIAPNGGQIFVFDNANSLAAWQIYIDEQKANPDTRRPWIYTYIHHNILMQLNANLTPAEADAYHAALEELG